MRTPHGSPKFLVENLYNINTVYIDMYRRSAGLVDRLAIRDNDQVKNIALRAFDLDPEMREWLANTVEGLPQGRSRRQRKPPAGQDPQ